MSASRTQDLLMVTIGLVLLGGLAVLSVRAYNHSQMVVQGKAMLRVENGPGARVEEVRDLDGDSLLVELVPGERDPFVIPVTKRKQVKKQRKVAPPPPAPKPVVEPELRSLLFDQISPSIQLVVGSKRSGWLKEGDVFQGWTVIDISPVAATVAHDGRQLELRSYLGDAR